MHFPVWEQMHVLLASGWSFEEFCLSNVLGIGLYILLPCDWLFCKLLVLATIHVFLNLPLTCALLPTPSWDALVTSHTWVPSFIPPPLSPHPHGPTPCLSSFPLSPQRPIGRLNPRI